MNSTDNRMAEHYELIGITLRGQRWLEINSVIAYLHTFALQCDSDDPSAAAGVRAAAACIAKGKQVPR